LTNSDFITFILSTDAERDAVPVPVVVVVAAVIVVIVVVVVVFIQSYQNFIT